MFEEYLAISLIIAGLMTVSAPANAQSADLELSLDDERCQPIITARKTERARARNDTRTGAAANGAGVPDNFGERLGNIIDPAFAQLGRTEATGFIYDIEQMNDSAGDLQACIASIYAGSTDQDRSMQSLSRLQLLILDKDDLQFRLTGLAQAIRSIWPDLVLKTTLSYKLDSDISDSESYCFDRVIKNDIASMNGALPDGWRFCRLIVPVTISYDSDTAWVYTHRNVFVAGPKNDERPQLTLTYLIEAEGDPSKLAAVAPLLDSYAAVVREHVAIGAVPTLTGLD